MRHRHGAMAHYTRALMYIGAAELAAKDGLADEAVRIYRLALGHLAESHDDRTPATRLVVAAAIAALGKDEARGNPASTQDAGSPVALKPALSTDDDVTLLQDMAASRRPIEAELAKKGSGR